MAQGGSPVLCSDRGAVGQKDHGANVSRRAFKSHRPTPQRREGMPVSCVVLHSRGVAIQGADEPEAELKEWKMGDWYWEH